MKSQQEPAPGGAQPDARKPEFTKEEVERRALEAARRVLATPKSKSPVRAVALRGRKARSGG